MSFRSCSTIPVRTGRRCCRSSRPLLRQRFASRRHRSPKRPHHRTSCRLQVRQQNSRPSPPRHLRGRRRRSARSRADYPRSHTRTTRTPRHRRKPIPGRGRPAGTDHRGRPHVAGGVRSPAPQPFTQAKATAQTDYFTLNEQAGTFIPACC